MSSAEQDSLWADDFGQKVDLCRRIQEILTNYPQGISVLKELTQNADDANATIIRFVYDSRTHPCNQLEHPNFSQFQGPSLLIHNDAEFTKADFQSIQSIGSSLSKKDHVNKTGRFGLGFNSVYHLSELPSFVSNTSLVYFDPSIQFLPNPNPVNPGKKLDFVKHKLMQKCPNQFGVYQVFDNDMMSPFHGTLFRLPLRTEIQAKTSKLSTAFYTKDKIESMYQSLIDEGDHFLLFLKSISTLEWYEWTDITQKQPTLRYRVNIKDHQRLNCNQIELRQYIQGIQKPHPTLSWMKCDVLQFQTWTKDDNITYDSQWIVCNALGGGQHKASAIAANPDHAHLKLLAYGGCAGRIVSDVPWQQEEKQNTDKQVLDGRAFTFLSLPINTNLPVHLNGYFELSSNRRNLWWSTGDDMASSGSGSVRYQWNATLLEEVISRAYVEVIKHAKILCGSDLNAYYKLWPFQMSGNEGDPFHIVTKTVLQTIADEQHKLLYSTQNGGQWLRFRDAVISTDECHTLNVILLQIGLPIVVLPNDQRKALEDANVLPCILSPGYVRKWIQEHSAPSAKNMQRLDIDQQRSLIVYILSDFIHQSATELDNTRDFPQCLDSLPILPMYKMDQEVNALSLLRVVNGTNHPSLYYSDDKECLEILSYTNNPKVCSLLMDMDRLSRDAIRILNKISASKSSNLCSINDSVFCELLAKLFKREKRVVWKRDSVDVTFIERIWKYISRNRISHDHYKDIPIVPTVQITTEGTDYYLCCPQPDALILNAIKQKSKGSKNDTISLCPIYKLLITYGPCVMLDTFVQNVPVDLLCIKRSIFSLRIDDVLRLLVSLPSSVVTTWRQSTTALTQSLRCLRQFILASKVTQLTTKQRNRLRSLPIYDVYGRKELADLTSSTNKYIAPLLNTSSTKLLSSQFIHIQEEEREEYTSLLRLLQVPRMRIAQFYSDQYFDKLESFDDNTRHEIMIEILEILHHHESPDLEQLVRPTRCIPSSTNTLQKASELYDPNKSPLPLILEAKYFPISTFCTTKILSVLRELGLKDKIEPDVIVASAISIANGASQNDEKEDNALDHSVKRAKALLRYLDRNTHSSSDKLEPLRSLAWLPIVIDIEPSWLPYNATNRFASSNQIRMQSMAHLCSSRYYVLDMEINHSLQRRLGLNKEPTVTDVTHQLIAISKAQVTTDTQSKQWLTHHIPELYKAINSQLRTNNEKEEVKAILYGQSWIWVNGHFANSDKVALNPSSLIHCEPYLEIISGEYHAFRRLFTLCGVKKRFGPRDYRDILNVIADKYKDQNATIPEMDIDLAIKITQYLSRPLCMDIIGDDLFPIPTQHNTMEYPMKLYYNDASWIDRTKHGVITFAHPTLSIDVCKKLGVQSFRTLFVSKTSQSLQIEMLSTSGLSGATAFGQQESLTRRLKDILRKYPEGPSILYEFLQNSDDAKAKNVVIMLNEKHYRTDSLLSSELKPLQGPALLIWNDAQFSENDFLNLSRIGQGSKLQKLEATGRFGLGFNSCYHWTDVPSVVSNKSIVFFDPHTHYLPNATRNAPGIRIKFLETDLVHSFKDQFDVFTDDTFANIFDCTLREEYDGTLFRFPLRSEECARESEIKSEMAAIENIKDILCQFAKSASDIMLFLRHICSIKVMMADPNGKVRNLLHVYLKDETQREQSVWTDFIAKGFHQNSSQQSLLNQMMTEHAPPSTDAFYQYLEGLNTEKLPIGTRSIQITTKKYEDNGKDNEITNEFAVCESIGGGDSIAIACSHPGLKLIPYGSVAVRLQKTESQVAALNGRAFTFLPLPINTGLPVHVNSYFELWNNRRHLCHGSDMSGEGAVRHKWNESLLLDVLTPSYVHLIRHIAQTFSHKMPNMIQQYYKLFPMQETSTPFQKLIETFYSTIGDVPLLFCPSGGDVSWLAPSQSIAFVDDSSDTDERIRSILSHCDVKTVALQQQLIDLMIKYKSGITPFSPHWLRSFLSKYKSPPKLLSDNDCIYLLELCLQDINASNTSDMFGICILPLSNGQYTAISSNDVQLKDRLFMDANEAFIDILKGTPNDNPEDDHNIERQMIGSTLTPTIRSKLSNPQIMGQTNISIADSDTLIELLHAMLPQNYANQACVSCSDIVQAWIDNVWIFLKDKDIMDKLSGLCILPILSYSGANHEIAHKLIKPNSNSLCIDVHQFDEPLRQLLHTIGFTCIDNKCVLHHESMSPFILESNITGILKGMQKCISRVYDGVPSFYAKARFNAKCNPIQRRSLRECLVRKLSNLAYQKQDDKFEVLSRFKSLIRSLPIYEIYKPQQEQKSDVKIDEFVDLSNNDTIAIWPPSDVNIKSFVNNANNQHITISFLKVKEEETLLKWLNVQQLSQSQFYDDYILKKLEEFTPKTRDDVVLSLLRNLESLEATDASFVKKILKHKFLPTGSTSKLCRIEDVYVPHPKLRRLLDDDVMPSAAFSSPDVLKILSRIGLKAEMDLAGIILSAKSITKQLRISSNGKIESMNGDTVASAMQRAQHLLKYLDEHWVQLKDKSTNQTDDDKKEESEALEPPHKWNTFVAELQRMRWVPISEKSLHPALVWKWNDLERDAIDRYFARSSNIRCQRDAWMVSATYPVMSMPLKCESFIKDMNWHRDHTLNYHIVSTQWAAQGEYVNDLVQRTSINQHEDELNEKFEAYLKYLNDILLHKKHKDVAKEILNIVKDVFLFVDGYCVRTSRVAYAAECDASPFLITLNKHLANKYRCLWDKCLTIKTKFEIADYVTVLKELHDKYSNKKVNHLNTIRSIIKALANADEINKHTVYVPDNNGVLCSSDQLVFNDAKWLNTELLSKQFRFVDDSFSNDVLKLRVKSFRNQLSSSEARDCTAGWEIKRIFDEEQKASNEEQKAIDDVEDTDQLLLRVSLSMVEIADVLESRQFELCLDENEYPTKCLLNDGFKALQGPSLVFKFDKPLNIDSIHNLHSIDNDVSSLLNGKSLQFQSSGLLPLYHLAESLLIVSQDKFIVFDPADQYVCDGARNGACRIYSHIGMLSHFPDQFKPFLPFGLSEDASFTGTIIRVPLRRRNGDTALSDLVCNPKISFVKYNKIKEHLSSCLLFGSCIENVIISTLSIGSIQREVVCESRIDMQSMNKEKRQLRAKHDNAHDKSGVIWTEYRPQKYKYTLSITEITKHEQITSHYLICNNLGVSNSIRLAITYNRAHGKKARRVPHCSVAMLLSGSTTAILADGSQSESKSFDEIKKCSLDNYGYLFVNGCPLYKTDLPIHVNGHFVLQNQCRDNVLDSDTLNTTDFDWNRLLLFDCIVSAYVDGLCHVSQSLSSRIIANKLYELWPSVSRSLSQSQNRLCHQIGSKSQFLLSFYSIATKQRLFMLSKNKLFLKMEEAYFPSRTMRSNITEFLSKHCDIFEVPLHVMQSLRSNAANLMKPFEPKCFRKLLDQKKSSFRDELADISKIYHSSSKNDKTRRLILDLLTFCVSDLQPDSSVIRKLKSYPLLPLFSDAARNIVFGYIRKHRPQSPDLIQYLILSYYSSVFGECGKMDFVLAPDAKQRSLLPHFTNFIHPQCIAIAEPVKTFFDSEPFRQRLGIRSFDADFVSTQLHHIFPYKPQPFVKWEYTDDSEEKDEMKQMEIDTIPRRKWIELFWQVGSISDAIKSQTGRVSHHYKGYPLIPLTNQCLCSVSYASKIALIKPIGYTKVKYISSEEINLAHVLTELNYPMIDWSLFPSKDYYAILYHLPSVYAILETVLTNLDTFEHILKRELSNSNRIMLMNLCCQGAIRGQIPISIQIKNNLKTLPIFSRFVSDNDSSRVFIPFSDDMTKISTQTVAHLPAGFVQYVLDHSIVLKCDEDNTVLYQRLGIKEVDEVMLVSQYIDQYMNDANADDIVDMIKYIATNWNKVSQNEELKPHLINMKLIPTAGDGPLLKPSELYDSSVPIFATLFHNEHVFPHKMFYGSDTSYLKWLKELGMTYQINGAVFVKCVQKLQRLIDSIDLAKELCDILTKAVSNSSFTDPIFEELRTIAFLPCKRHANNESISICCPNECVLQKDYDLAWTVSPILNIDLPEAVLRRLKISTPPIEAVLNHCNTLSIHGEWTEDVLMKIIRFFDRECEREKMTETHMKQLKDTRFIPIGSRLVKPSQVFMSMDGEDLSPFLFKIPAALQRYKSLFEALGTKQSPTIEDYDGFLLELYKERGDKKLNVNELNAVVSIIIALCNQIQNGDHRDKHPYTLVPSESSVLVWSTKCVYNDSMALYNKIQDVGIDSKLEFAHPRLSASICCKLNITPLSASVTERLNGYRSISAEDMDHSHKYIINCIHSDNLYIILQRIALHYCDNPEIYAKWNAVNKLNNLKDLTVQYCSELYTSLVVSTDIMLGQEKDHQINDKGNVPYFLDKSDKKCILYINPIKTKLVWPTASNSVLSSILSSVICDIVDLRFAPIISALSSVLMLPLDDGQQLLDFMGISRLDYAQRMMKGNIHVVEDVKEDLTEQEECKYPSNGSVIAADNDTNDNSERIVPDDDDEEEIWDDESVQRLAQQFMDISFLDSN
eukprot:550499_1